MSQEFPAVARQAFREAAELEDSGTRGGVTWARYVAAMQRYGEGMLHEVGGVAPAVGERLELALAGAVAALKPPRRPGLDLAIGQLRVVVEEADAVLATAGGQ